MFVKINTCCYTSAGNAPTSSSPAALSNVLGSFPALTLTPGRQSTAADASPMVQEAGAVASATPVWMGLRTPTDYLTPAVAGAIVESKKAETKAGEKGAGPLSVGAFGQVMLCCVCVWLSVAKLFSCSSDAKCLTCTSLLVGTSACKQMRAV